MKITASIRRFTAMSAYALLALASTGPTLAEDIDIFTSGAGTPPPVNVLFILDNSSNWSATLGTNECQKSDGTGVPNMQNNTKFAAEMCSLTAVLAQIAGNSRVRLGLMMFTESGNNGAYVRFAIRDMTSTNATAFSNMLKNFVQQGSGTDNSGSNQPYAKAMYEAFKYFGGYTNPANANTDVAGSPVDQTHFGGAGPSGSSIAFAGGPDNNSGSYRRDYAGNNAGPSRAASRYGADDTQAAFSSSSDNTYLSPLTDPCARTFIIFISNGNPGTGGDSSVNPARDTTLLANVHAVTTAIPNAANETHPSKMDEFALFLRQTDVSANTGRQSVQTYTIAVYQPTSTTASSTVNPDGSVTTTYTYTASNTDSQMIRLMKSAATAGNGKYCDGVSATAVKTCILSFLNDVQAVNDVFVSASLPVSVNNQGTFLNQVYMGMFRPDDSAKPRWLGNVKEYQFILDASTGQLFLGDANGNRAVDPATGFLSPNAVSFWTTRGLNPAGTGWPAKDYWVSNPTGTPLSASDSPDGEVVEKGGSGEVQRLDYATSQSTRKVLTCLSAGCSAGAPPASFDTTTIDSTYLTAFGASSTELPLLVNWVRGQDNANGTPCDPSSGSCTWTSAEFGPGWPATVRPSIHGDVLHSRPVVLNYTSLTGCASTGCPYIFYGANDGTLRAAKGGGNGNGHEQWAFVAPEFFGKLRRLRNNQPELRTPATDPLNFATTAPKDYFFDGPIGSWEDPDGVTKWIFVTARRGGAIIYAFDVTDPSNPKYLWKKTQADLPNLGQTWSLPQAFKLTGDTDPTLIFGAGYDVGEDASPVVNNSVGRGIYVLNARTGALKAFIHTSVNAGDVVNDIPSDIALLTAPDGQVYRGYVGDMGGNVWRLDIPSNDVTSWKLFKFGSFPGKKFFFAPDLVHAGAMDVVLAGSGDREKPLDATTQDSFYGIFDMHPEVASPVSMTPITTSSMQSLSGTGGTSNCTQPSCLGWYRDLTVGEKVVNSPLTVAGVTYFSTNRPTPTATSCTNLGEAKAYSLQFNSGSAPDTTGSISTTLTGGGLPPSPVGGVVQLNDGQLVTFIIGAGDAGSAIEGGRVTLSIPKSRKKVYWNAKTDT